MIYFYKKKNKQKSVTKDRITSETTIIVQINNIFYQHNVRCQSYKVSVLNAGILQKTTMKNNRNL